MNYPLLTKVLADAQGTPQHTFIDMLVAHVDPAIADRLERALDVCQTCGMNHDGVSVAVMRVVHRRWIEYGIEPHQFVPLVTP